MALSQDYISELVNRNDIVDVVSSYVKLRRRGRTHTGLCPFHNEKTPSFVVYPDTQSFYCFGCGSGGDAITFIKKISNLDYIEAVKFLASRVGMAMPEDNDEKAKLRSTIYAINKDTARFYFDMLNSEKGLNARAYLRSRALSDKTIRHFGLGFSPDSFRETKDYLLNKGYNEYELLQAGIIKRSEKGNTYDVFRNRVMFPIIDLRGNVIAFGGRNMGDEKPKYLNSGDTQVFKKSKNLFALNLAKKSTLRRYILAEGYMDVIAMHQAGFDTAVATLGTALTAEQATIIAKYADEVVLSYDSDEAGQKATQRAIGIMANEPTKVSVLNIPNAKDPDEFIKRFGADRFKMLLDGSNNAIEYKLLKAKRKFDLATNDGRLGYIKDAMEILSGRLTATERDVYAGRLAEETGTAKTAVVNQLESVIKAKQRKAAREREKELLNEGGASRVKIDYKMGGQKALGAAYAEQQLIAALLKNSDFYKLCLGRLSSESFISEEMKAAYTVIEAGAKQSIAYDFVTISPLLPDNSRTLISKILAENYDIVFAQKDVEYYIQRMINSVPVSSKAAEMDKAQLVDYIENLKNKKL